MSQHRRARRGAACVGAAFALAAIASQALSENKSPEPLPGAGHALAGTTTIVHAEIPRLPLSTYAKVSDDLVHVQVVGSRAESPVEGLPYTVYTAHVLDSLRGGQPAQIEFAVGGSSSGDFRVRVVGAPEFVPGDEAALFLDRVDGFPYPCIVGLGDGAYRVMRDATGVAFVRGLHASEATLDEFFASVAASEQEGEGR